MLLRLSLVLAVVLAGWSCNAPTGGPVSQARRVVPRAHDDQALRGSPSSPGGPGQALSQSTSNSAPTDPRGIDSAQARPGALLLAAGPTLPEEEIVFSQNPRGRICPPCGPPCVGACDGPRRVPEPFGPEAVFARTIGFGSREATLELMWQPLRPAWARVSAQLVDPMPLLWPVEGFRCGRGFGHGPHNHRGIDIAAPEGTPIRAVADGFVAHADNKLVGHGNALVLLHGDRWVSVYSHCERLLVYGGQVVERGQVVARVGETGRARGTHLHFELRRDEGPLDPMPRFENVEIAPRCEAVVRRRPRRRQASDQQASPSLGP